jgi:lysophospholipase L1-like esterase
VLYGDGLLDGNGLDDSSSLPVLLAAARPDLEVFDMGLGQERSAQVLERIRQASTARAAEVVLWAGSYDAAAGTPGADVGANVGHMLDALPGAQVTVILPLDLTTGADAPAYTAPLRATAAAHGARVLDAAPALVPLPAGSAVDAGMNLTAAADAALAHLLDAGLAHTPGAATAAKHRVLLAGDSLVNGSMLPDAQSLPVVLATSRPDLDVVDEGVGGTTTTDLLSRLRQLRSVHADEVVLWIGTNDADQGIPVATFSSQLGAVVDALSPAKFVLVSPIPDYSTDPNAVPPYAQATRDLAGKRGLALVDVNAMVVHADYLDDGVHVNAAAEKRITTALSGAL